MTFKELFDNCSVSQIIKVGYENDCDEFVTLVSGTFSQDFKDFFESEVELIYAGMDGVIYVEIECCE